MLALEPERLGSGDSALPSLPSFPSRDPVVL